MSGWHSSQLNETLEKEAEEIPLSKTKTAGLVNRSDVDEEALQNLWKNWEIGQDRTLKLEFKNNLLLLSDYLMARHGWTFPIKEWLEQIWELKKLGYLGGRVSAYILDEEDMVPLLAGSERGSVFSIIAPRDPGDSSIYKEKKLRFNERGINENLYSRVDTECMKEVFKNPEMEEVFYCWSTSD